MTDDAAAPEKKFTQADVDRLIRDRLAREREKYADYDDLKAAAATADKNKSQIDKLTESIQALTQRAEKAEHDNDRRTIADEFGLTPREARRLSGKTLDDLRADAKDLVDDLGIDVKARKAGKTATKDAPAGDGGETEGDGDGNEGGDATDDSTRETVREEPARRGRPREALRSGAPVTRAPAEETDPMKLVADIPRRF